MSNTEDRPFRVLCLDGGGAKGVYSLGILSELEIMLGNSPLDRHFDLIYGTSTGAIIGSLLALSWTLEQIVELYFTLIPDVMGKTSAKARTEALVRASERVFQEKGFDSFTTMVGVVCTNRGLNRPTIFKSHAEQVLGRRASFTSGFGRKIREAVVASAAATPYFDSVTVETEALGKVELIDGGFVANNPTLFALVDAQGPLAVSPARLRVLSIGTGSFPQAKDRMSLKQKLQVHILKTYFPLDLLDTTLSANANATEYVVSAIMPAINYVRISDAFHEERLRTNLLEADIEKLKAMLALGRESFGRREDDLRRLFDCS